MLSTCQQRARGYATHISDAMAHRVLVVGGGTAGITIAAQLQRSKQFRNILGRSDNKGIDIAIVDPAIEHHYQPGWTLIGAGLKAADSMHRAMQSVIPAGVKHYVDSVVEFTPESNYITTRQGKKLYYDYLVVAAGLQTNLSGIEGLEDALADSTSGVSTIYSLPGAKQTWSNIKAFKGGKAIFTQPPGVVKCAGAPQKIMWMARSQWRKQNKLDGTEITFATGSPGMFSVPKYAEALDALRQKRGITGLFQHQLTSIDSWKKQATFRDLISGKYLIRDYDLLHVTPPQQALKVVATSPLADESSGFVKVDSATLQHKDYPNVFAIGDSAGLPTSKTAAAISSQAPVLVDNLIAAMDGTKLNSAYQGYSSCPLLTGHGELMLCEFKYGGEPAETFAPILGSQHKPRRLFYHLKKDIFPPVYWRSFLKGSWFGSSGIFRPKAVPLVNVSSQAQPAPLPKS